MSKQHQSPTPPETNITEEDQRVLAFLKTNEEAYATLMRMAELANNPRREMAFGKGVSEALKEAEARALDETKFQRSLEEKLKILYPDFAISEINDLSKVRSNNNDPVAGINPHKIVVIKDKDGNERVLHLKQAGPVEIMPSRFNEIFIYKALEALGYGPQTHAIFFKDQPNQLFTLSEDVVSAKHFKHKDDAEYQAGDYHFKTLSQIDRKLNEDAQNIVKAELQVNQLEGADQGFRSDLLRTKKEVLSPKFTDDKEAMHFAELHMLRTLLNLQDVQRNYGNWGIREKRLGSISGDDGKKSTPMIIDFALRGNPRNPDTHEPFSELFDRVPKSSPSNPVGHKLFGHHLEFMLDENTLRTVSQRFDAGRTGKKGEHKPGFKEAINQAFDYTKKFYDQLVENGDIIPGDLSVTSGPNSPTLRSQSKDSPSGPFSHKTSESKLSGSISRKRNAGLDIAGVEKYRDDVLENYGRFEMAVKQRLSSKEGPER